MLNRVTIGLVAMSAVVMWWTAAEAQNCVQWRDLGGSLVCTVWRTKGVLCEVKVVGEDCGRRGEDCNVTCKADTYDSVAFCRDRHTHEIYRSRCHKPLHFMGSADRLKCTTRDHSDDTYGDHHRGHDRDDQVCTTSIVLQNPACDQCCRWGDKCIDVTPVTMTTKMTVRVDNGHEHGFTSSHDDEDPSDCDPDADFCTIEERCKINANKIKLGKSHEYQCRLLTEESEGLPSQ